MMNTGTDLLASDSTRLDKATMIQHKSNDSNLNHTHWILLRLLLVAIVSVICYTNSAWGDFVYDDLSAILNNQDLNPETPISNVFANDFWGFELSLMSSHKSYRPLTVLTFRWNYWLAGGLHPMGFHLVNIALHALVSVVYLELCWLLLDPVHSRTAQRGSNGKSAKSPYAVLAAVLFAVHPIHSESVSFKKMINVSFSNCHILPLIKVASVVGRAELLSALCFFTALLTYIQSCRRGTLQHVL